MQPSLEQLGKVLECPCNKRGEAGAETEIMACLRLPGDFMAQMGFEQGLPD